MVPFELGEQAVSEVPALLMGEAEEEQLLRQLAVGGAAVGQVTKVVLDGLVAGP